MIDYRSEDVVARVKELTGGKGVKVVYDSVGKDTFERSLDCLAPFGLLVAFGNASGPVPPFDLLTLIAQGLALRHAADARHALARSHLGEMAARAVRRRRLRARSRSTSRQRYPLAEAAQRAHAISRRARRPARAS